MSPEIVDEVLARLYTIIEQGTVELRGYFVASLLPIMTINQVS